MSPRDSRMRAHTDANHVIPGPPPVPPPAKKPSLIAWHSDIPKPPPRMPPSHSPSEPHSPLAMGPMSSPKSNDPKMTTLRRQCATYKQRIASLQSQLKRSHTLVPISEIDIIDTNPSELQSDEVVHDDEALYQKHRDILSELQSDEDDEKQPMDSNLDRQRLLKQYENRLSQIQNEYLVELESHHSLLSVECLSRFIWNLYFFLFYCQL